MARREFDQSSHDDCWEEEVKRVERVSSASKDVSSVNRGYI